MEPQSQIEDIGEVVEDIVDPTEPCMEDVTIAGVKDLFTFKTCLLCKHKIALTPSIHIDDVVTWIIPYHFNKKKKVTSSELNETWYKGSV